MEDMEMEVQEVITSKLNEAYAELLRMCGKDHGDIAPSEGALLDQKEEELIDAVCGWLEAMLPESEE